MKKSLLFASALLVSAVAFGQKKELREVEKQIKKGDLTNAKSALESIKGVAASNKEFAPQYYFLEGQLNLANAKKNVNVASSLQNASVAFAKVRELEGGKGKYVSMLQPLLDDATNIALTQAQESYGRKDFKNATTAFEQVYRLSPRDTVFLYNAALVAVQDKNYDAALKYYKELKDLNYDGTEVLYFAKEKQTGKEETFPNKSQRDLMVKGGTHSNPRDEKTPSKRAEIIKNIAYIYVEQGKNDEALAAFAEARKRYPNDANLIVQEASIHMQLDNKDKFKELMQEAAKLEPKNPDLQYNIGVINMQQNHLEEARKAFQQALSIKPDYADAVLNISTTYINEGNALVEQMNSLGNSKADIAKYEELRVQKDDLFKKGAEILENFYKTQGRNENILEQLKNIYGALGDSANFQRVKGLLGQ
ncbi:tetratricopeptide repeat protein [Capnocytophaga cynodegmi]|uniref:tetratricopeptide repeat protein n=1 Tax=Capnocytophaga cynodegmi TaxID=28189 RepID=UPI00385D6B56